MRCAWVATVGGKTETLTVKNGETKRARATIALIQELEQQQKRLQKKTD